MDDQIRIDLAMGTDSGPCAGPRGGAKILNQFKQDYFSQI